MYTYQYGDIKYQLVEAKDLVVVRTTEDVSLEELSVATTSRSLMSQMVPIMAFPEANVTVYKIVESSPDKIVSLRNTIRRQLKTEDEVIFAGRVLKDPRTGSVFVYTENIFVKFKDDLSSAACEAIIAAHQLEIAEQLPFGPNSYFTRAAEGTGMEIFAVAEKLLQHKSVEHCHPELVGQKTHKAAYPLQWHLIRTRIRGHLIDQHVDIESAWAMTRGEGITIAIVDDGVDVLHPEFSSPGKVVAPRNTVWNTDSANPLFSSDNHGTACAGVACANGSDKASGVAPEAKLLPIKIGGLGSLSEAKAFAWAADHGADVISCSWGPPDGKWWNSADVLHYTEAPMPDSTRLAIDYATREGRNGKGCVIVWAGGNGNENIRFDGYATYPKVIAVAACNDRGKRSIYSDYGDAVWCSFPSSDQGYAVVNHPHPLTAGIWTVDRRDANGYNQGGMSAEEIIGDLEGQYTATFGGTSSACPGVAGVVALMLAVNPDLNWQQVKSVIRSSCDKIDENGGSYDSNGHSPYYGYGRINAGLAVRNAIAAKAGEIPELDLKGVAHFKKAGEVSIQEGTWLGLQQSSDRFLGFQLRTKPFQPGLELEYRVKINSRNISAWTPTGEFAGTTDRRRKLIGFAIRLKGQQADQYDVIYQAQLQGEDHPMEARNGATCGTENKRGRAIEAIQVMIRKKA